MYTVPRGKKNSKTKKEPFSKDDTDDCLCIYCIEQNKFEKSGYGGVSLALCRLMGDCTGVEKK